MLHYALSILLATTITACPLFCRAGVVVSGDSADVGVVSCGCHGGHAAEHEATNESEPRPASPNDGGHDGVCQCVCGGAVVESVAQVDASPDTSWSAAWPMIHITASPWGGALSGSFDPPPSGGHNPGRALRCLHQTFLC